MKSVVDPFREGGRFLTQQQEADLAASLDDVAVWAPTLARIVRREERPVVSVSTSRPKKRGSEPPINVVAFDLLDHAHVVLGSWAEYLVERGGPVPPAEATTVSALARHLGSVVDRVACQDWAVECKTEVDSVARQMREMVEPDEPRSIAHRYRLADVDVHHRAHQATGDARDMAAVHLAVTGELLPESTVRSWVARGKLEEVPGLDGAPRYRYSDVASLARLRRARQTRRKRGA